MDKTGGAKTLISAWVAPRNVMISNDAVAGYPDRLVGIGSVDISSPVQASAEIRRCVEELVFSGILVLPWLWEIPPTDRPFCPVYTACCELGVLFCTQIGHTEPLMPSEVGRPVHLDRVALDFPELLIVAGHIGYPWTDETVTVATKHPNVYIDTSARAVRRYPVRFVDWLRTNGPRKVLFGSNCPIVAPARALDGLDDPGLSQTTSFMEGDQCARSPATSSTPHDRQRLTHHNEMKRRSSGSPIDGCCLNGRIRVTARLVGPPRGNV